jgi:hypothetical protein
MFRFGLRIPRADEQSTDPFGELFTFDPMQFIWDHPYVLLIPVLLIWLGISLGWKKLQQSYRMQGKPLRSLGPILSESYSLMFKEDNYPILQFSEKVTQQTAWLTWVFYWKWVATFTLVTLPLMVLGLISGYFLLGTIVGIILLWLMGIGHLRNVFGIRMHRLTQMFNVAAAEAKYESGAIVDLFSYIQVESWADVYHPEKTIVMFPTKYRSEDTRNRASFETNFSGSVTDQNSWSYTWESSQNRVICEPVPFIPTNVPYPFPDENPWNAFPLGVTASGEEAVWDVSNFPHALVAGTTGSGKSVTQRTILLHALQSPQWRVVLVDPKRVELSAYKNHPNVLKFVTELEDSLALIEQLEQEMHNRYNLMEEEGVNNFQNLQDVPPAILLMVDETFQLLSPSGIKSEEGKAQDEMKARIGILLSSIARLGRASGLFQVLATQRPDAKVLPGELKANLDARIAQGRMDTIPSNMTLDSDAATKLPPIKGRAVYRAGGDQQQEFQAYFLAPEHLPEVLDMSAAIAKGETDFLNAELGDIENSDPIVEMVDTSKSPKSLWRKFTSWLERKEQQMAERPGGEIAPAESEDSEEAKISAARSTPDISAIVAANRDNLSDREIEPLFVDADPPKPIDEERLREVVDTGVDDDFTVDPSLSESDWYDEEDMFLADDDFTAEEKLAEWEDEGSFSPTETEPEAEPYVQAPIDLDDFQDFEDGEPESMPNSSFTVQDVIARAAERGAPIPASELLAALQAEASQIQKNDKPKSTTASSVGPQTITPPEESSAEPMEDRSKPDLPSVISAPPGRSIPQPPPTPAVDNNFGDLNTDSDNNGMQKPLGDKNEDFNKLNPLEAPWIPKKPVEYDEADSPFDNAGFGQKKPDAQAPANKPPREDEPSSPNAPRRPKRPGL